MWPRSSLRDWLPMSMVEVQLHRLPHGVDLALPSYETEGAAGADLRAAIANEMVLAPGERALVPTGLSMALPAGYEGQVRPRSGLAARHGVTVLNSPGTIDSDYRGEVHVPLINHSGEPFTITRGMRIAQLVVAPVTRAQFVLADTLPPTARAHGGFGSTGTA